MLCSLSMCLINISISLWIHDSKQTEASTYQPHLMQFSMYFERNKDIISTT